MSIATTRATLVTALANYKTDIIAASTATAAKASAREESLKIAKALDGILNSEKSKEIKQRVDNEAL